jgi:superfamily I DNA/RNA helicase/mRNA-degrading endonuclease RelE of RelBE toxin-antitoxin system
MAHDLLTRQAYLNDRQQLPPEVQRKVFKCERLLAQDFRNPGLQTKKLHHSEGLFEARVDQAYRLVYTVDGSIIQLLAVGPHDIIDKRLKPEPVPAAAHQLAAQQSPLDVQALPEVAHKLVRPLVAAAVATAPETKPALPRPFSEELLEQLQVPAEYAPTILACSDEDALLSLSIPDDVSQVLLDYQYPPSIEQVADEPTLVVDDVEDLQRHSDGELVRFLLYLDDEQRQAVEKSLDHCAMVRGGPGTGKSTVALYRAKRLLEKGPANTTLLFTTFTNALVNASRDLLESLLGPAASRVEVSTIDRVAMQIAKSRDRFQVASDAQRKQALDSAYTNLERTDKTTLDRKLTNVGVEAVREDYLLDEFEWVIDGRGLADLAEYLDVDRRGRGYGFDQKTRTAIWELYTGYCAYLTKRGLATWKQIGLKAVEHQRSSPDAQRWDYVVIDETQDLAPVSLALAIDLCRSPSGVFFAADGGQSIYQRGFSISQINEAVDLRGRSTVLRRNYRTTKQIALAAQDILSDDLRARSTPVDSLGVREGPTPRIIVTATLEDQIPAIAGELRTSAREFRLPLSATGILAPNNRLAKQAAELFSAEGIPCDYMTGRDLSLTTPTAKALTIHSAKGLEFPFVVVVGVDEGTLPRPLPDDAEDENEHIEAQRRLLYVACTRAMRQLWVCGTSGRVSRFVGELDEGRWDAAG